LSGSQLEDACTSFWRFAEHVYDKGGMGVLGFLFMAMVFHRLVRRVWWAAMQSKNAEIERLICERNSLLSRVFQDGCAQTKRVR